MSKISEETGKTVRGFFDTLKEQPLSLALVVMNFLLVAFLFYSGAAQLSQRQETTKMIIAWQQDTDKLMASCVSADIMRLVLDALNEIKRHAPDKKPGPLILPDHESVPEILRIRYPRVLICG